MVLVEKYLLRHLAERFVVPILEVTEQVDRGTTKAIHTLVIVSNDYQPSRQLIEWFTDDGDLIVDPFLGTGTNAVATSLVGGGRTFVGSDLRDEMVKTANYRVQTEGGNESFVNAG